MKMRRDAGEARGQLGEDVVRPQVFGREDHQPNEQEWNAGKDGQYQAGDADQDESPADTQYDPFFLLRFQRSPRHNRFRRLRH
jgi:hypothetical protein